MVGVQDVNAARTKFLPYQVRATKTLLRFCQEHGHSSWTAELERCIAALENHDEARVRQCYVQLWRGGMDSFLDWSPIARPHEDQEYLSGLWDAVSCNWANALKPFDPSSG